MTTTVAFGFPRLPIIQQRKKQAWEERMKPSIRINCSISFLSFAPSTLCSWLVYTCLQRMKIVTVLNQFSAPWKPFCIYSFHSFLCLFRATPRYTEPLDHNVRLISGAVDTYTTRYISQKHDTDLTYWFLISGVFTKPCFCLRFFQMH